MASMKTRDAILEWNRTGKMKYNIYHGNQKQYKQDEGTCHIRQAVNLKSERWMHEMGKK